MSNISKTLQLNRAEKAVLLCIAIILVGSILPWTLTPIPLNSWNSSNVFMLGIGVILPVLYAGLLVSPKISTWLRTRKSGDTAAPKVHSKKVGSLSLRQFGQVSAWLSLSYFLIHLLTTLSPMLLIGTVGATGLVLVTVLDRQIFGTQMTSEPAVMAAARIERDEDVSDIGTNATQGLHKTTTGGIPVIAAVEAIAEARNRKTVQPEEEQDVAESIEETPLQQTKAFMIEDEKEAAPIISAERSAEFSEQSAHQTYSAQEAFWFAVHYARPVVDERSGEELFQVEPGNWILALTTQPDGYVVRSDSGVVGLMKDVDNIERA